MGRQTAEALRKRRLDRWRRRERSGAKVDLWPAMMTVVRLLYGDHSCAHVITQIYDIHHKFHDSYSVINATVVCISAPRSWGRHIGTGMTSLFRRKQRRYLWLMRNLWAVYCVLTKGVFRTPNVWLQLLPKPRERTSWPQWIPSSSYLDLLNSGEKHTGHACSACSAGKDSETDWVISSIRFHCGLPTPIVGSYSHTEVLCFCGKSSTN